MNSEIQNPTQEGSSAVEPGAQASTVDVAAQGLKGVAEANPLIPVPEAEAEADREQALHAFLSRLPDLMKGKTLSKDVQQRLAALIDLGPLAQRNLGSYTLQMIELAINALLKDPPELDFAVQVQKDLAWRLRWVLWRKRFQAFFQNESQSIRVFLGLSTMCFVVLPMVEYKVMRLPVGEVVNIPLSTLLVIAAFGALGGAVSIMTRLRDFDGAQVAPATMFLFGFFKPIVGSCFALFTFGLVHSELLPIKTPTENGMGPFLIAISFLSGFSERFAKDVVTKAESQVLNEPPDDSKPAGASSAGSEAPAKPSPGQ